MALMREMTAFKLTHDNWCPAWQLSKSDARFTTQNLVQVSVLEFHDRSGYRVCVWGADDDGMEKDFKPGKNQRLAALRLFNKLLRQPYVDKSFLRSLEFVNA